MTCPSCKGQCYLELFTSRKPCEECKGKGSVPDPERNAYEAFVNTAAFVTLENGEAKYIPPNYTITSCTFTSKDQ